MHLVPETLMFNALKVTGAMLVVLTEYLPQFYSEVVSLDKGIFLEKDFFLVLSLPLLACMWEGAGAKCDCAAPETARRDALATQHRPESAVFLVKEEEGIVRK